MKLNSVKTGPRNKCRSADLILCTESVLYADSVKYLCVKLISEKTFTCACLYAVMLVLGLSLGLAIEVWPWPKIQGQNLGRL